jgi:hypothetical protein
MDNMRSEIETLKKGLTTPTTNMNNVNNKNNMNNVNNKNNMNNNNSNNTITINNYMSPSIDHIRADFVDIFNKKKINTPVSLIRPIWFNKNFPENHSIYMVNKKTKEILVYEDGWRPADIQNAIMDIYNQIFEITMTETSKQIRESDYWNGKFREAGLDPELVTYVTDQIYRHVSLYSKVRPYGGFRRSLYSS